MIKFENTEVVGWEHAIRGMRNPMNSWEKSDSECLFHMFQNYSNDDPMAEEYTRYFDEFDLNLKIGPNDLNLMKRLRNAGTDHRKFMRMITVYTDITAPLYWWKEFDTYKIGTVANSCSTMHKIQDKEFDRGDFSYDHIPLGTANYENSLDCKKEKMFFPMNDDIYFSSEDVLDFTIRALNHYRELYLETKDKKYWWQMIQLLPSSYNQKRTVMLNYEVLANIYKSRKGHKLDEWSKGFIEWIESLPYAKELIIGEKDG